MNKATDILFDKIIAVELQHIEEDTELRTIVPMSENTSGKSRSIGIYEGSFHYKYVKNNATGTISKTKIEAGGSSLHKDISDKTYGNWWTDTAFMKDIDDALSQEEAKNKGKKNNSNKQGCKISISSNGKTESYHAVYLQTSDISAGKYHVTEVTNIPCPPGELKPAISFTTNVIPGNGCYKLILKIVNLHLNYDVRKVRQVKVTAGYRTMGMQRIFTCPVFTSYIESPNPDGVTVFECLCVGSIETNMDSRPIEFRYMGGKITIKQFLEAFELGLGTHVYNYLSDKYNNLHMQISGTNVEGKITYAENVPAALTWARRIIQKRIASSEGYVGDLYGGKKEYPYICIHSTLDGIVVYALNRPNRDSEDLKDKTTTEDIVVLDAVKGASFNGVALTVRAAWDPRLIPGNLFKMIPNIYNGENLPNVVGDKAFGKDKEHNYYYRCITCSISFSTTGSENEMTILAVPVVYAEEESPLKEDTILSWKDYIAASRDAYDTAGAYHVTLGSAQSDRPENTELQENKDRVEDNVNDMFETDILNYFSSTVDYEIQPGDSLSRVAQKLFAEGEGYCDFKIQPEKPTSLPQGVWVGELQDRAFLWPLIAVVTYRRWLRLSQSSSSNNGFETMEHLQNPDNIQQGRKLVIPVINNFDTLKRCKEIFKYAHQAWNEGFPSYQNWVRTWHTVYQYLGGTFNE